MRLLPALALAQVFGIWVADRGWIDFTAAAWCAAAVLAIGVAVGPAPAARRALSALLAALAGAASLALQLESAASRIRLPTQPVVIEGTVVDSVSGIGWSRVDVARVRAVDADARRVPANLRLVGGETPAGFQALETAQPGDRIRARVRLRELREPRNPGSPQRVRALERRGIGARGRLEHPALHVRLHDRSMRSPLRAIHERRRDISAKLATAGFGSELVRALALGDLGGLSNEVRDAFRRLGLSHILSVSGLHLALVASLAFATVRVSLGRCAWLAARRDTRIAALLAGVLTAVGYALFSGWAIPARRSLVFLLVLALAIVRGRSRQRAEPLAAAAIFVLAVEPDALFEAGPQLSFAATAALMFAARRSDLRPPGAFRSRLKLLDDAARTSACAVAVTAPIAAWQLGSAAPFAWLANLIAIPCFAIAVLPSSLLAALALGCGFEFLGQALVSIAVQIAAWTLEFGLWLASQLPVSTPPTRPAAAYLLCTGVCVALTLKARTTVLRVIGSLIVSALVSFAPPVAIEPPPPRLVALEVDQGSATLVEGQRAAILVDAGSSYAGSDWGERAVVPALAALGIDRLDVLVVSHGDLDHRGGVPSVLKLVSVGEVWVPHGAAADPAFEDIWRVARSQRIPVVERGVGSPVFAVGDLRIEALWPPAAPDRRSRNDRSLVVRIQVAGQRVLLPGDLEAPAESDLVASGADLRAEVLALPHHGSRTSSSEIFLDAVGASVALASAPCGGRFGMPHAEALERARESGVSVWWTGRDGAVMVGLGGRLRAWGYRESPAPDACALQAATTAGGDFR